MSKCLLNEQKINSVWTLSRHKRASVYGGGMLVRMEGWKLSLVAWVVSPLSIVVRMRAGDVLSLINSNSHAAGPFNPSLNSALNFSGLEL
jgi:hypothetical protein